MNNETNTKQYAETYIHRATGRRIDYNRENFAFQTTFNKYETNKITVTNPAHQKNTALTGITADSINFKQKLCQLAANIAGVIYAYASTNHNETLKQEMNLLLLTLTRTRDEYLAPCCQNIHDKAANNLAALSKETDDILKKMDKLIELYCADNPDFVNAYFETRIIIDPPTRGGKQEVYGDKPFV